MRTETVEIAGRDYEVQELSTRKNEAWRKELEQELGPALASFRQMAAQELSTQNVSGIADSLDVLLDVAMKSPVAIRELCFSYSPDLSADQERLLEEGYDSEFMAAFQKILGLAYPFGAIIQTLGAMSSAAPA